MSYELLVYPRETLKPYLDAANEDAQVLLLSEPEGVLNSLQDQLTVFYLEEDDTFQVKDSSVTPVCLAVTLLHDGKLLARIGEIEGQEVHVVHHTSVVEGDPKALKDAIIKSAARSLKDIYGLELKVEELSQAIDAMMPNFYFLYLKDENVLVVPLVISISNEAIWNELSSQEGFCVIDLSDIEDVFPETIADTITRTLIGLLKQDEKMRAANSEAEETTSLEASE